MFYIIDALSKGEGITQNTLKICLQYATGVIIVFAVIFLFYTNSFLIKRRKKEIGVYNILGMGKRLIARMMAVETILTAGISILGGLVFGIIFGKLMYLLLLKILHNSVDMQFSVNGTAIVQTVILFAGIFLLTYLYNILQKNETKTRMLFYFGIILLLCNAPFIDEHQLFTLSRLGRKIWFCGQILYILLANFIYFAWMFFVSIIVFIPWVAPSAKW